MDTAYTPPDPWSQFLSRMTATLNARRAHKANGGAADDTSRTDVDHHEITVTFFRHEAAATMRRIDLTLPELADHIEKQTAADKMQLPWLKLAPFGNKRSEKNCLRTNENTRQISGIEGDHDTGKLSFDDAVEIIRKANIRALLYTSASHVPGVKERWRILVPLSKNYPPEWREKGVARINGLLGGQLAGESFTLSQAYLFGHIDNRDHRVEVLDGDFLDLRDDLYAGSIFKDGSRVGDQGSNASSNGAGDRSQHNARVSDNPEPVALSKIEAALDAFSSNCPDEQWLKVAAGLHRECGESGFELFDAWSAKATGQAKDGTPIYTPEKTRKRWHGARTMNDITIATLFRYADKADPTWRSRYDEAERERIFDQLADDAPPADDMPPADTSNSIAPSSTQPKAGRRKLAWRELRKGGAPAPSMHNARVAIIAMGLECSYDTFHDKMMFGYRDDTQHTVEPMFGEVTDHGILSLRRFLSDGFGFDLTEQHVRDAVISLALEHCFDPVADMLDLAEANWDGVKRLDRVAADYFNCEDTALNAACMRKTLIAAVARVRNPGCKFDNILTLEAPEGWNKSTAWRVLAGDENYSDESIIGKSSREVQEQLAGVWIHENAELAGMKKAEIEVVKAFASRQVDRARPAYGRFLKKQPRHSVEVGTTNSDKYLLSQTGNRRFWGMKMLKRIDLDKLMADRLQIWGEAAHHQRKGEALTLDASMWAAAGIEQEKRRVPDPWEDVLANMPDIVEERRWDSVLEKYTITTAHPIIINVVDRELAASDAILAHVLKVPVAQQTIAHGMRLAAVMNTLGWLRPKNGKITLEGRRVQGYFRFVTDNGPAGTDPDDNE